jgi:hypothetical protein
VRFGQLEFPSAAKRVALRSRARTMAGRSRRPRLSSRSAREFFFARLRPHSDGTCTHSDARSIDRRSTSSRSLSKPRGIYFDPPRYGGSGHLGSASRHRRNAATAARSRRRHELAARPQRSHQIRGDRVTQFRQRESRCPRWLAHTSADTNAGLGTADEVRLNRRHKRAVLVADGSVRSRLGTLTERRKLQPRRGRHRDRRSRRQAAATAGRLPWLHSTDGGRPSGRSLRSRRRSRARRFGGGRG